MSNRSFALTRRSSVASVLSRRLVVLLGGAAVLTVVHGQNLHAQDLSAPLPAIEVEATAAGETGTGPVTGYNARQSVTSMKTDTPVLETPQSVSIIPRDQIADQQFPTLSRTLSYTPGITIDPYSANSKFDAFYIRGFLAEQYLDGLKLPVEPGVQWATPRIEPYGLERIEVLKGPSSGLYGQTNPGGFVNMVSKRPKDAPHYEFIGQYGSFNRFQGAFDFGGPIGERGEFLYRMVGVVRESDSQIDFQEDNKVFFAPSLTWRPNADTSFTILASYQRIKNKGYQQYVPAQGTLLPTPFGRLPYRNYLGEPSVDRVDDEQAMIGYAFDHRINDVLQFRQNFRYTKITSDTTAFRGEGVGPDLRTMARSMNYVVSSTHNVAIDNQIQADFATGPLQHKVLLGADYSYLKGHADYRFAMIAPIDIYAPVYGSPVPARSSLLPMTLSNSEQNQLGVYIQDQIKWDRLTLSLTGRHDWAKTDVDSYAAFPTPGRYRTKDSAFTGRVGLSYLFDFGLAPYANYSTSFLPVSGVTRTGSPFEPTKGEGWEAGVKFQPNGTNLLFTAAYFDITQQNVLTPDPANPLFSVQAGEVQVKGFEFEARGNVTRELEIIGGFSHIDPKVTKSTAGTIGKTLPNVALTQASLWGKYTWHDGALAGLGLGAGVRHVGKLYGDAANTIEVKPYTLVDAMVSYDFSYLRPDMKGWKAQLNVTNLFNKYYVTNCFTGLAYCGYGQGRTILLSLKYSLQPETATP